MFRALADLAAAGPRRVLALVLLFAAVSGVLGGPVAGLLSDSARNFEDPGSESVAARNLLVRASGVEPDAGVVAVTPLASAERVRRVIATDPSVARAVLGPVAKDGRETYVAAFFRANQDDSGSLAHRLDGIPGVVVGGAYVANNQVGDTVKRDLARAELYAFPLLFVLSLLVFRSVVSALLPLFVGGITVLVTFLLLRLVNAALPLSIFAINLVTGLGLGLAIDYSLFVVSRYREELAAAGPGREALRRTLSTAGRTVFFSSLTVAAALASLTVFPQRFLYSMGIGGVLVALTAAATSLVALPALLAVLGTRVNALAPARWRQAAERSARGERGWWYRLSQAVMHRPALVAAATAALLIAVGVPFLGIRFTGVDAGVLPTSASARQVNDVLGTRFPRNRTSPVYIAVSAPADARTGLDAYAARLRALPGAAAVTPPQLVGRDAWRVDVVPRGDPLSDESKRLVDDVRAVPAPFPARAGGETAAFLDQQSSLRSHVPIAIGILALTTLLLLFAMTGSVVLPLKSLVMNALSLSAAFGLLVLVFQDGRLEGLLNYKGQGALDATQPILLFALAFGLSTDYGVFLLTRIKEARDRGASNREAVALGLERTGRIVTAAALLFTAAIGAFSTSQIVFIKELGIGTALAVLIDATIVRALLVPSLMALLGEWNWWAPGPLRRIHERFGLSEG